MGKFSDFEVKLTFKKSPRTRLLRVIKSCGLKENRQGEWWKNFDFSLYAERNF